MVESRTRGQRANSSERAAGAVSGQLGAECWRFKSVVVECVVAAKANDEVGKTDS